MKPAAFDYVRAENLDEALTVLAEHGSEARIIAGGQSLLPMLNMRLAKPALLVDIMGVAGLDQVWRVSSRCWRPPCPGSATTRPARAAPSAAPSLMPTQAPRYRFAWSRSVARFACALAASAAYSRRKPSSRA
jgi:hypothetical protein